MINLRIVITLTCISILIIIVALVKYDFIVFFFGCILLVSSILCACFGWHWSEREDMIEYTLRSTI